MGEKGLESKEALRRLHSELEATLARCHARRSHVAWMKEAWLPGSAGSLFRLTSLVCAILLALALVAASPPALPALVSAALILALTTLSLVLSGWESYQRSVEVFRRAEHVARLVREAAAGPGWSAAQHPHLHTPRVLSRVTCHHTDLAHGQPPPPRPAREAARLPRPR